MRQNLTNVKETQLDKVDSFYIVGSTTKEGLIEGRSNVKIDLKKAIAEGGGDTPSAAKFTLDSIRLKSGEDLNTFFNSLEWTSEEGNENERYVNDPINIKELFVRDDFDFWEFAMKQNVLDNSFPIEIASIPVGDGEDETVTAHFGTIEGLMPPVPTLEIDFLRNNRIVSKVFCRMFPNEQGEYKAYLNESILNESIIN